MGLGRQTLKHTAVYSIATIIGKLAGFLMLPFYAHIFQTEGYGIIAMIDTSLGILMVLLSGGFSTAILRIYHEQEAGRKGLVLSTGIQMVWVLGILIIVLPLVFSAPLSRVVLGNSNYYPLFCLSLITFVIDVAGQSASTYLIIGQRSLLFSSIGILRMFIGLFLNIWLIIILQVGLIGVFISSLVTAAICTAAFHVAAFREHGLGFDKKIAGDLLRFQLPLILGDIISFLGRQAERVMVRINIGLAGVGVLEMAYMFPPLINIFITIPFTRAWRTKSIEIAEQVDAPQIIGRMFTQYLFLLVFAGLVMGVTIQSIIELVTPADFWPAVRIAHIEIFTVILAACTTYLNFGIFYRKQTKIISYVKTTLTPVKIGLAFIMISAWGLSGAAYSALVIEGVTLAWITHKAQKMYPLPLEYMKIFTIIAGAMGIFFLLEGNRYTDFAPAVYAKAHFFPELETFLLSTQLGEWKHGRLVQMIHEKQDLFITLFLNALFSLSFLAMLPLIWRKGQSRDSEVRKPELSQP